MNLKDYIEICGETSESKGFDLTKNPEQLLFTATEIGEALEELDFPDKSEQELTIAEHRMINLEEELKDVCRKIKEIRQTEETNLDYEIGDKQAYLEELSDILIWIFSYVYGNDYTEEFISALKGKMQKNADREQLHGKKM